MLLPTEMAPFLRACGKFGLNIRAFELTFVVRSSAHDDDGNEQVVRIRHRKSGIEKDYIRFHGPNWATVFELDLLSGHFGCQLREPDHLIGTASAAP
jgi:hypothetical protein